MSKSSPAKYENLVVANATLDAAEDQVELLQRQLQAANARAERLRLYAIAFAKYASGVNDPAACWIWTHSKYKKGYGYFRVNDTKVSATRASLFLFKGEEVPEGMAACHTCDNPPCVNPAHLWVGTIRENALDAVAKGRHAQKRKTHCPQGHEYNEENTKIIYGERRCLQCPRDRRAQQVVLLAQSVGTPEHETIKRRYRHRPIKPLSQSAAAPKPSPRIVDGGVAMRHLECSIADGHVVKHATNCTRKDQDNAPKTSEEP